VTLLDRASGPDCGPKLRSVRRIYGDTRDAVRVASAMAGQDCVAHLAAGSSFLMYELQPVEETAGATVGFHTVLEAAVREEVPRIVYLSTSAVYEGNRVPYRETMPLDPPDLKALSKKVNEETAALYEDRYGIETVGLRPFSVYGPGETTKGPFANVISLFAWAMQAGRRPIVWGDGSQTRDFIAVDDVARAVVLAITSDHTGVLNVGTGIETSFIDVVEILNEFLGISYEPEYISVPINVYASRLLADPNMAHRILRFDSTVSVRAGVRLVLEHVLELPARERRRLASMQEEFRRGALVS